jgi:hypothetical protein
MITLLDNNHGLYIKKINHQSSKAYQEGHQSTKLCQKKKTWNQKLENNPWLH